MADGELAAGLWGDAAVTMLIGGPFDEAAVADKLAAEVKHLALVDAATLPPSPLPTSSSVGPIVAGVSTGERMTAGLFLTVLVQWDWPGPAGGGRRRSVLANLPEGPDSSVSLEPISASGTAESAGVLSLLFRCKHLRMCQI